MLLGVIDINIIEGFPWGETVGALIGGLIAFFIARYQIKIDREDSINSQKDANDLLVKEISLQQQSTMKLQRKLFLEKMKLDDYTQIEKSSYRLLSLVNELKYHKLVFIDKKNNNEDIEMYLKNEVLPLINETNQLYQYISVMISNYNFDVTITEIINSKVLDKFKDANFGEAPSISLRDLMEQSIFPKIRKLMKITDLNSSSVDVDEIRMGLIFLRGQAIRLRVNYLKELEESVKDVEA